MSRPKKDSKPDLADIQFCYAHGNGQKLGWRSIDTSEAGSNELSDYLKTLLTTPNLLVLAGSGTSMKGTVNGPSMSDLWDKIKAISLFADVKKLVNHPETDSWIENLLSRCQSAKGILKETDVSKIDKFLTEAEKIIWRACTEFLASADLESHRTFLSRMARRRLRAPRIKLFTTNYDLCFETAAGDLGIVAIDGFSFTHPRTYDARYFEYDLIRRSYSNQDLNDYVEGVIHLYKIHGSVNWHSKKKNGHVTGIEQRENPDNRCLIYPSNSKYEHSYSQPYLEMISQLLTALRQPNTCLVTVGFGFNDNHLSAPIIAAAESNPSFKLLVVGPFLPDECEKPDSIQNRFYDMIQNRASNIALLKADFQQFTTLIPDLKALTPAEQLAKSVKNLTGAIDD